LAKSIDGNQVIQKCVLQVKDTASRNTIDRALSRNKEAGIKSIFLDHFLTISQLGKPNNKISNTVVDFKE
jgi:hypothetical protein